LVLSSRMNLLRIVLWAGTASGLVGGLVACPVGVGATLPACGTRVDCVIAGLAPGRGVVVMDGEQVKDQIRGRKVTEQVTLSKCP
jgi:hypothetical protein